MKIIMMLSNEGEKTHSGASVVITFVPGEFGRLRVVGQACVAPAPKIIHVGAITRAHGFVCPKGMHYHEIDCVRVRAIFRGQIEDFFCAMVLRFILQSHHHISGGRRTPADAIIVAVAVSVCLYF